jgi:hypothetical protein
MNPGTRNNAFRLVPPTLTPPATPEELMERTKLSRWQSDSSGAHLPRMPVRTPRSACASPTTPKFSSVGSPDYDDDDGDAAASPDRKSSQLLMIPTKFWYDLADRDATSSDGAGPGVTPGLHPPRSPQRPALLCRLPLQPPRSSPSPPPGFLPSSKGPAA